MTRSWVDSQQKSPRMVLVFTRGPVKVPPSPRARGNNFLGRDVKSGYHLWRTRDDPGALDRIFETHGQVSVALSSHCCSSRGPAIGWRYSSLCTEPQRFSVSFPKPTSESQEIPDSVGSNHHGVSMWSSCIMSQYVFLHCFLTGVAPQPRHTKGTLEGGAGGCGISSPLFASVISISQKPRGTWPGGMLLSRNHASPSAGLVCLDWATCFPWPYIGYTFRQLRISQDLDWLR